MKTKFNSLAGIPPPVNMQSTLPSYRNPAPAGPAEEVVRACISREVAVIYGQINKLQDTLEKLQEEFSSALVPLEVNHNPNAVDDPPATMSQSPILAQIQSASRRIEGVIRHVEHLRTRNQL